MAFRVDIRGGQYRKPAKTPQGFLRADALPTRAGVFTYRRGDGTVVRELRLPEEVFNSDSLATLAHAPLTDGHPSEPVNPSNVKALAIGHMGETPERQDEHVCVPVYVTDAEAIKKVETREKLELSGGYYCDLEEKAGVYEGQAYDKIQRNIRYNHVALVERGRAGPENRIRLDANDGIQIDESNEEYSMDKITIDGVDYEVSPTVAQAFAKREAAQKSALEAAQAEAQALSAKVSGLEIAAKKADEDLAQAKDPKVIAEAVKARLALVTIAEKNGVKHDGLSDDEVRRAVAEKYGFKLDGKDAAFVAAAFEIASEKLDKQNVANLRQATTTTPVRNDSVEQPKNAEEARRAAMERSRNAYKGTK